MGACNWLVLAMKEFLQETKKRILLYIFNFFLLFLRSKCLLSFGCLSFFINRILCRFLFSLAFLFFLLARFFSCLYCFLFILLMIFNYSFASFERVERLAFFVAGLAGDSFSSSFLAQFFCSRKRPHSAQLHSFLFFLVNRFSINYKQRAFKNLPDSNV